jgi:hypothetical protein
MLMQPEQAPPPDYNFILQDKPQPKKSLMPNMPKAVLFGGGAVVAILVLILVFGLIFGKKSTGTTDMLEALGRGQEISRVTAAQSQKLKDQTALSIASTTQASLTSEQSEISSWLAKRKVKTDPKKLTIYSDTSTDALLQQAAQNNNLDAAYLSYLQKALSDYSNTLARAYAASSSPTAKAILKESFNSTQTLLSASVFKPSS